MRPSTRVIPRRDLDDGRLVRNCAAVAVALLMAACLPAAPPSVAKGLSSHSDHSQPDESQPTLATDVSAADWYAIQRCELSNGAIVDVLAPRDPIKPVRHVEILAADGETISIVGFHVSIGAEFAEPGTASGIDEDITGDGVPDLVISDYSGGAHCCLTYYIFSVEPDGRVAPIAQLDLADGGMLSDRDGDSVPDVVTSDWHWRYVLSCFACIEYPEVVLRLTPNGYEPALDLMWREGPSEAEIRALVADLRNLDADAFPVATDRLWSEMLRLVYSGHGQTAWKLFDAVRGDDPKAAEELGAFRACLESSPYWAALNDAGWL